MMTTSEAAVQARSRASGKNTIRKAGCGLANQIGGFVILGARWDKSDRVWRLSGVVIDHSEPELWIGQLIGDLRPAPRFEAKAWKLDRDRTVAVVRVEPVDEPPCMTPQGHVYEACRVRRSASGILRC